MFMTRIYPFLFYFHHNQCLTWTGTILLWSWCW